MKSKRVLGMSSRVGLSNNHLATELPTDAPSTINTINQKVLLYAFSDTLFRSNSSSDIFEPFSLTSTEESPISFS